MTMKKIEVYTYRWVVLLLFFLANAFVQINWITFASINTIAQPFYGVDELSINLLSLTFMVVYIPITFISAWITDKYDFKVSAGTGAAIMGVFSFLRFFAGQDYSLLLIFQTCLAIGQPFLLNSVTKLSANWFPETERTTATGISLLSTYIGIALGLALTPVIVEVIGIQWMLLLYGILSLIVAIIFITGWFKTIIY
ncbi:MAG: MFS transporter [Candidatus Lokiarchaeota archaeon]